MKSTAADNDYGTAANKPPLFAKMRMTRPSIEAGVLRLHKFNATIMASDGEHPKRDSTKYSYCEDATSLCIDPKS